MRERAAVVASVCHVAANNDKKSGGSLRDLTSVTTPFNRLQAR